jgi:hypothetical protein
MYNVARSPSGAAGWRDFGAPYGGAAYYRDNEGIVHLSGVSQSFAYSEALPLPTQNLCGGGDLFTLPAGDRPETRAIFAVDSDNAHGRVDVAPDGEVICMSGAGDQYVSLSGIPFRAGG